MITQCVINRRRAGHEEERPKGSNAFGPDWFSQRICEAPLSVSFHLPSSTPKYDGATQPETWLDDYLTMLQFAGGDKDVAMRHLQLQLEGSAHAWLNELPANRIWSWDDLEYAFTRNIQGTYKRPATIQDLRAYFQKEGSL